MLRTPARANQYQYIHIMIMRRIFGAHLERLLAGTSKQSPVRIIPPLGNKSRERVFFDPLQVTNIFHGGGTR